MISSAFVKPIVEPRIVNSQAVEDGTGPVNLICYSLDYVRKIDLLSLKRLPEPLDGVLDREHFGSQVSPSGAPVEADILRYKEIGCLRLNSSEETNITPVVVVVYGAELCPFGKRDLSKLLKLGQFTKGYLLSVQVFVPINVIVAGRIYE